MTSPDLILEHADECCFLWHQRRVAVFQPNLGLEALGRLDERLLAHLDGLRVAGDEGLDTLLPLLAGEPGAAWAATILAAESGRLGLLDGLLAGTSAEAAAEAVAWLDAPTAERALLHWTTTGGPLLTIAAAAAGYRGVDEPRLAVWAAADAATARAAFASALRLGVAPVADVAQKRATDPALALAAHTVLAVAGSAAAAEHVLTSLGTSRSWSLPLILAARCSDLAAHAQPPATWLDGVVAGAQGDPGRIPALITCLDDVRLARCAGEAIVTITGVDLRRESLVRPAPPDASNGPSEDPADTDVALEPDEDLPWPDREAVQAWWERQPPAPPGRLLAGLPVAQSATLLEADNQRLRWAAAIEQMRTGGRLFPVDGPVATQRRLLAVGR